MGTSCTKHPHAGFLLPVQSSASAAVRISQWIRGRVCVVKGSGLQHTALNSAHTAVLQQSA